MQFLFAFLGGIILNLMPCVFPVLSLKVLALVKRRSSNLSSGLSYTAGVLVSFFALSGTLLLLKNLGFVVGWGYNLQSPMFVVLLSYLLFIVGLNLSGVFSIPMFSVKESNMQNNSGSFFTGVIAVLVATPCTAPFMATAIGFAFTQPTLYALLIFQALGLGFAFPYLLCAKFTKLLSFLPKPGNWMEKFKELLAFPMYFSAIWLFWVLIKQTNGDLVLPVLAGTVLIVFTIWLWNSVKFFQGAWKHFFIVFLIFVNFVPLKISYDLINYARQSKQIAFSEKALAKLLEEKNKVLVVVTADWCLTCKINEQLVLLSKVVQNALEENNVIYMLADWTKRDENITNYIKSFNRIGVPLYVLYNSKGEYKILPQLLTQEKVVRRLEDLK
ncbi:MAG: thioredoxin family protein [Rickettsiaceae bacterium H1]|nr:thioredoxin family protein [Rickettsiaceae bacterium H1]